MADSIPMSLTPDEAEVIRRVRTLKQSRKWGHLAVHLEAGEVKRFETKTVENHQA